MEHLLKHLRVGEERTRVESHKPQYLFARILEGVIPARSIGRHVGVDKETTQPRL